MQSRESLEGAFQVIKLLSKRPSQWEHCIILARLKFEKYFKKKVKNGPGNLDLFTSRHGKDCIYHNTDVVYKALSIRMHCNMDVVDVVLKALQLLHSFPLDTRLKDGSKYTNLYVAQSRPTSYFTPHLIRHTWLLEKGKVVMEFAQFKRF